MKNILLLAFAFFSVAALSAQKTSFTISYPISLPLGSMHDYISNTSFLGVAVGFNRQIEDNLHIGIESGWNVFYQRKYGEVLKEGNATVSGVQFRYTNAVPILAVAKYYRPGGINKVSPYFGFGVGTMFASRRTEIGSYVNTTDTWQFCLRPEAGILVNTDWGLSPLLGVKYYGSFKNKELDGQSYLSLNLGVSISGF